MQPIVDYFILMFAKLLGERYKWIVLFDFHVFTKIIKIKTSLVAVIAFLPLVTSCIFVVRRNIKVENS